MYLAIQDHGIIGNLRTAALVSIDGTIDFFCPLRFDNPTLFASLLDEDRGGYCSILSTPVENSPEFRSKIPQSSGRKFPSTREVVVYSFGWRVVHKIQPVKRRRALLESNSPRNIRLQTHQDDEARGEAGDGLALGLKRSPHRIDRFAHA